MATQLDVARRCDSPRLRGVIDLWAAFAQSNCVSLPSHMRLLEAACLPCLFLCMHRKSAPILSWLKGLFIPLPLFGWLAVPATYISVMLPLKVHAPPRVQLRSSTPVTLGTDITNHQSPLHSFSSRLSAGGGRAPSAYSLRSWPIAFLPLLSFCLAKILTWKWPATT